MELFFSPFACSLASRIAGLEAGLDMTMTRVDLMSKDLQDGGSLFAANPKGQVPTLRLDDGSILTEGAAVLQYLADQAPQSGLAPAPGSLERYRLAEWLNFIATELHKRVLYMAFAPGLDDATRQSAREAGNGKIGVVAAHLESRDHLVGDKFTVADAYLLWFLLIAPRAGVEVGAHPSLRRFQDRCLARPAVARAVAQEQALRAG